MHHKSREFNYSGIAPPIMEVILLIHISPPGHILASRSLRFTRFLPSSQCMRISQVLVADCFENASHEAFSKAGTGHDMVFLEATKEIVAHPKIGQLGPVARATSLGERSVKTEPDSHLDIVALRCSSQDRYSI